MDELLRRGRLEVETDILLGVEDVLLPPGFNLEHAQPSPMSATPGRAADGSPPAEPRRGFDADLFATRPRGSGMLGASGALPREPAATSATAPVARPQPTASAAPSTEPSVVSLTDSIPPPAGGTNAERLASLAGAHARDCPHCTSVQGHTNLVFGEGDPDAQLVFVGEAPGEMEDRTGRPFVGPAGEKLDEMIAAMGLRRSDVYIANVLKARPPNNRTPLAHEVERCGPYLLAQLAIIRPKVIVTLGGPATKLLLASELGISRLRGIPASVKLGVAEGRPFEVAVIPTFHPAYLLRNYTRETRLAVWSDLKQALAVLGREPPAKRAEGA